MKISAYSAGKSVPSARFRIRQLIPFLAKYDLLITEYPARPSIYPPDGSILKKLFWFLTILIFRLKHLIKGCDSDVVIFQKELISSFLTFEFIFKRKSIFDVDDAIWLKKYSLPAKIIASNCKVVVVGNTFLKDYFVKLNTNIYVIPTAVDSNKYIPSNINKIDSQFSIGWIGTSGGFKFFTDDVQLSLNKFLSEKTVCKLKIVADKNPYFKLIDSKFVEFILWSEETEVDQIQSFDIGIMPLDDSEWSLGKCSYKMLLYMSCSIPVVVTNIGMNSEILNSDEPCGLGVEIEKPTGWHTHLDALYRDDKLRFKLGVNGRKIVERNYSLEVISKKWVVVLNSMHE